MHYGKIDYFDVADGPGVRVGLYVSGCRNFCEGCHNSEAWDFNYGTLFGSVSTVQQIVNGLNHDYIKGLSILGGEPLERENIGDVTNLCYLVKNMSALKGKDIWLYTGYLYEDIDYYEIMNYIDVLVDGPFIQELKDPSLAYRGSSNQRIIDVKKSRELGYVVEVEL